MKVAVLGALAILLSAPVAQAERPGSENPVDVGKVPESGPVVGGTATTTGPNSKNQALSPMPGLRSEELSEKPPDSTIFPPPEVHPMPNGPAGKKITTPAR